MVGAWWPRSFNPEIDIVGADRSPVAREIHYVGSIKWLGSPFDRHAELIRGGQRVPGAEKSGPGLVVVSRPGVADGAEADVMWTPDDVLGVTQVGCLPLCTQHARREDLPAARMVATGGRRPDRPV